MRLFPYIPRRPFRQTKRKSDYFYWVIVAENGTIDNAPQRKVPLEGMRRRLKDKVLEDILEKDNTRSRSRLAPSLLIFGHADATTASRRASLFPVPPLHTARVQQLREHFPKSTSALIASRWPPSDNDQVLLATRCSPARLTVFGYYQQCTADADANRDRLARVVRSEISTTRFYTIRCICIRGQITNSVPVHQPVA
ncbi:Hypothetical protein CINCED_3A001631 [Cinara cedri]|uniref:Uncharacterized protein n=1 Tax=Cinara cedri TaxID=506608 RepID=A0A5E4N9Z2_9HEMI|nr:Hypothetical protein CINCED_3A001631 [Cinara cedri]